MTYLNGITPFDKNINLEVLDNTLIMMRRFYSSINMDHWLKDYDPDTCGTTACIRGWISITYGITESPKQYAEIEKLLRGLDNCYEIYLYSFWIPLYRLEIWPLSFRYQFIAAPPRSLERFEIIKDRIIHFLKEGE